MSKRQKMLSPSTNTTRKCRKTQGTPIIRVLLEVKGNGKLSMVNWLRKLRVDSNFWFLNAVDPPCTK